MSKIGIIDSGTGGISTLSAILSLLPNEEYIYVSDKSHSPYGNKSAQYILQRINTICGMLKKMGADAVVIACNTATSVGIESLRENKKESACGGMIYVGVEPAVKPAIQELTYGRALVLLTPTTAVQPKFLSLIGERKEKLVLAPQSTLAALIENNINDIKSIEKKVYKLLSHYSNNDIESVVLGCTHYCLIKDMIANIFPYSKIYDGNAGTAIRLYSLLKEKKLISSRKGGGIKFIVL